MQLSASQPKTYTQPARIAQLVYTALCCANIGILSGISPTDVPNYLFGKPRELRLLGIAMVVPAGLLRTSACMLIAIVTQLAGTVAWGQNSYLGAAILFLISFGALILQPTTN